MERFHKALSRTAYVPVVFGLSDRTCFKALYADSPALCGPVCQYYAEPRRYRRDYLLRAFHGLFVPRDKQFSAYHCRYALRIVRLRVNAGQRTIYKVGKPVRVDLSVTGYHAHVHLSRFRVFHREVAAVLHQSAYIHSVLFQFFFKHLCPPCCACAAGNAPRRYDRKTKKTSLFIDRYLTDMSGYHLSNVILRRNE